MYETRVLEFPLAPGSFRRIWPDVLPHLEETESKAEIALNLDRKVWENKEAAV